MHTDIIVRGIVQGVGFRPFVYRIATKNNLVGYVRNLADAGVEIVVEGNEKNITKFLSDLKKPPPLSKIYNISLKYHQGKNEFDKFIIHESLNRVKAPGSVIPPDVSICKECLNELRETKNRRYNYFFITCTNCGPRYTTIKKLPYDRKNTTIRSFPICDRCGSEYNNPLDRRFHAQTIACKMCGPQVHLITNDGDLVDCKYPIREAGKLIEEGNIIAVKGNGGFHIASSTIMSEPILRLRKVKCRVKKPFAIMARDLETVQSFAEVSAKEADLLASYIRPIVLLKKSKDFFLSEHISPDLHNIGVMLPYTGLHYMLFDSVKEPAFVMTSGNPPNEPIVVQTKEALERLGSVVNFILTHNRRIAQRCDDSVVRVIDEKQKIIRRSRGFVPAPIHLKFKSNHSVLGLGAELNVNVCFLLDDKAYMSQHIGDLEKLETVNYLRGTVDHLLMLTKSSVEAVACDLHPGFISTRFAQALGNRFECDVIQVQHHYAHIASLMGEHGISEIVGICCDGFGYGLDSNAWGGEILYCDSKSFRRLGHLQEQPMVGGDLATKHPLRMLTGIIYKEKESWLMSKAKHFPYGEKELEVILQQLESNRSLVTTSCGRILDAISALLGICYQRTYEGEPAMKLESIALKGKDVLKMDPVIEGHHINTTYLVLKLFDGLSNYSIADLAYSAESYLARCLAQFAVSECERIGIKSIGFSGGVAYNKHISLTLKKIVEKCGFKFIVHSQIPPGDGGISFGQTITATKSVN